MNRSMPTFDFQLVLGDIEAMNEEIADALYEAGCDDGTAFSSNGIAAIGFSREAQSLEEAVRSAIADVNKAGLVVTRVASPDDSVYDKINQELARN
jgi:hypothetical protein